MTCEEVFFTLRCTGAVETSQDTEFTVIAVQLSSELGHPEFCAPVGRTVSVITTRRATSSRAKAVFCWRSWHLWEPEREPLGTWGGLMAGSFPSC